MKQLGAIVAMSILLTVGCSRLFPKATVEKVGGEEVLIVKGSFESAWEGVIGALAVNNIPIKAFEKKSGLVESDLAALDPKQRYTTCDGRGIGRSDELGMSFIFSVKAMNEEKTAVRLASRVHELSGRGNIRCSSTGKFEQKLFSSVRNQLSQQKDLSYRSSQKPPESSSTLPGSTIPRRSGY